MKLYSLSLSNFIFVLDSWFTVQLFCISFYGIRALDLQHPLRFVFILSSFIFFEWYSSHTFSIESSWRNLKSCVCEAQFIELSAIEIPNHLCFSCIQFLCIRWWIFEVSRWISVMILEWWLQLEIQSTIDGLLKIKAFWGWSTQHCCNFHSPM